MPDGFGRGYRRQDMVDDVNRALTAADGAREGEAGLGRGRHRVHPRRSCRAGHFLDLRPTLELAAVALVFFALFGSVLWLVAP